MGNEGVGDGGGRYSLEIQKLLRRWLFHLGIAGMAFGVLEPPEIVFLLCWDVCVYMCVFVAENYGFIKVFSEGSM